jgi:hypothetical protein
MTNCRPQQHPIQTEDNQCEVAGAACATPARLSRLYKIAGLYALFDAHCAVHARNTYTSAIDQMCPLTRK